MRRSMTGMLILIILSLAACGNPPDQHGEMNHADHEDGVKIQPLEVDLQVPAQAQVGETVDIRAVVSLGEEKVNHVDQIEFQIWKDDDVAHGEMIKADPDGENGVYSIAKSFDEPGVYSVQSHVTARDMHTMPMKKITVESSAK